MKTVSEDDIKERKPLRKYQYIQQALFWNCYAQLHKPGGQQPSNAYCQFYYGSRGNLGTFLGLHGIQWSEALWSWTVSVSVLIPSLPG